MNIGKFLFLPMLLAGLLPAWAPAMADGDPHAAQRAEAREALRRYQSRSDHVTNCYVNYSRHLGSINSVLGNQVSQLVRYDIPYVTDMQQYYSPDDPDKQPNSKTAHSDSMKIHNSFSMGQRLIGEYVAHDPELDFATSTSGLARDRDKGRMKDKDLDEMMNRCITNLRAKNAPSAYVDVLQEEYDAFKSSAKKAK